MEKLTQKEILVIDKIWIDVVLMKKTVDTSVFDMSIGACAASDKYICKKYGENFFVDISTRKGHKKIVSFDENYLNKMKRD